MIASVNPLASAAGVDVLRGGGNAIDAAVAAGAVLTVVEPWSGQLGGDAFMLVRVARTGEVWAINGSGAAPLAATLELYRDAGRIPETGWLAATVPGVVDAWRVALERFGSRPLGSLLEPAIHYAQEGFPLTARQSSANAEMAAAGRGFPETADIFFPEGRPFAPGDRLRQHDLARTLSVIGAQGADAFYRGEIAQAVVEASTAAGGLFSQRDLAEHRSLVSQPLRSTYRGWTVLEQPPVSQGIVVLLALSILDRFELASSSVAESIHLQVEAHKLALLERLSSVGDPAFVDLAMDQFLSRERCTALSHRLDPRRAAPIRLTEEARPDTTYLCVVDAERNVVSYIHSLYGGNGVVAGDTGILLNNRMLGFSLERASPNRLGPGKRPMHTLNSWMLLEGSALRYVGGTPGAFWQVQLNLQLISRLVDRHASVQEAVDAPRWVMGPQTDWGDSRLSLEGRFGLKVIEDLRARGHQVDEIGEWAAGGAAQVIELSDGMLIGAADPRPGTSAVIGY